MFSSFFFFFSSRRRHTRCSRDWSSDVCSSDLRGESIRYAVFTLPIGRTLVAATSRGLCAVKLGDDEATLRRLIGEEFSAAELIEDPAALGEIRDSIASFLAGAGGPPRGPGGIPR